MRALTLVAVFGLAVIGVAAGAVVDLRIGAVAVGLIVAGVGLLGFSTERLTWLLALAMVFVVTWNGLRVPGGAVGNLFMVAAFGAAVAHALLSRQSLSAPPTLMLAALGFFLAGMLSLIWPPDFRLTNLTDVQLRNSVGAPLLLGKRSNVFLLIQVEISFIVIPLIMLAVGQTVKRCRILLDVWTLGLIVNALIGFMDTEGLAHLTPRPLTADLRSAGLTLHANYLALGTCMAIPTAMLWIGRERSRLWSLAGIAGTAILLGGVYASGSRAGAVAAVAAVCASGVAIPRLRRFVLPALPYLGMAAIVVLMFTKAGAHILDQVRLGGGQDTAVNISGSNFERSRAANIGWDQFSARPLQGVGFSVITDAHSIYLELLAAGGIIALVSFFVFVGGMVAAVFRGLGGPLSDEVIAVGIAIFVWLANGAVDNQIGDKYLYTLPGIMYAMARLSPARARAQVFRRPQPARGPRPIPV